MKLLGSNLFNPTPKIAPDISIGREIRIKSYIIIG